MKTNTTFYLTKKTRNLIQCNCRKTLKGRDYMSNNDYILNLLNIKDSNIFILDKIENKNIKGKTHLIIEGILTYKPKFCPCCGAVNESFNDIIKWGFRKNCKIKIPKISNCNSLLILHKQRFLCKHCNNTFIAETNLIEKDISERVNVSVSTVDKVLNDISSHTVLKHEHLPESMNWDEFKATKDTKGKMAFIITDNDSGSLFDIQDSRKSKDLEKYFRRYSRFERNKVKHISTDFYSGYIYLAEKLFKNAKISIDRFHIIIQAYNALNITRVNLCFKSNPHYNKLKYYWKLILKNENDLSEIKEYSSHFKKELSQKEIVTFLINTNKTLKATYECYQGIINSLKLRDFNKFLNIINHPNYLVSDKMKRALFLYKENIKYIKNSFEYDINNGVIEGTNNLIKCIKRIAFGYKRFDHFVARIFLIKGIIKE